MSYLRLAMSYDNREVNQRDLQPKDITEAGPDSDLILADQLEGAISRIPTVSAARVVLAPGRRVSEVHVLASPDRAAKQLVRDIQSVALASFGIEIDYRTVSVVQLETRQDQFKPQDAAHEQAVDVRDQVTEPVETAAITHANGNRAALIRLASDSAGNVTEIRVELARGDERFEGAAQGPAASSLRLVARAAAQAASSMMDSGAVDVDFAAVLAAEPKPIALVVLRVVGVRGDQIVSGSAVVWSDPNDAIARATLSALNRLVPQR